MNSIFQEGDKVEVFELAHRPLNPPLQATVMRPASTGFIRVRITNRPRGMPEEIYCYRRELRLAIPAAPSLHGDWS